MLKKISFLFIVLFSICLINVSTVFSVEAKLESSKTDIKDVYIDFINGMLLLKSMSAQYLPYLYPDMLYVGPGYARFNHQDYVNYTKKDTEIFLIDLKWQLNENWFWGIYSEIGLKNEDLGNDFSIQIKNIIDTNLGVIFIHKF